MKLAWNAEALTTEPGSPFALHLLECVRVLGEVGAGPSVALVVPAPLESPVPDLAVRVQPEDQGDWGRLRFLQRELPRAVGALAADLLVCPEPLAPLRSPVPLAVARSRLAAAGGASVAERLRRAAGAAGAAGAAMAYRYADEPEAPGGDDSVRLAPFVSSPFRPVDPGDDDARRRRLGLPPAYVLCHGADPADLELLLAAWTWVEASIGSAYPLLLLGLPPEAAAGVRRRAQELDLGDSLVTLAGVTLGDLPAIYRGAEAMLHSGHSRTGQEWRWALAAGVPLAAAETPAASAVLGPAAYLVSPGEARALGAACLTLLVERGQLGKELRERGLVRAAAYHGSEPVDGYWRALQRAAAGES